MTFWKWWTSFITVISVTVLAQIQFGIIDFIRYNDPTYITSVVIGIAILSTLWIGYFSYTVQFKNETPPDSQMEQLWFIADTVMSIGMVGTLIGFLMVLTSTFTDIDTSSAEEMRRVIGSLAAGMGVALLTSLAGLLSSIYLKLQLVLLESGYSDGQA